MTNTADDCPLFLMASAPLLTCAVGTVAPFSYLSLFINKEKLFYEKKKQKEIFSLLTMSKFIKKSFEKKLSKERPSPSHGDELQEPTWEDTRVEKYYFAYMSQNDR